MDCPFCIASLVFSNVYLEHIGLYPYWWFVKLRLRVWLHMTYTWLETQLIPSDKYFVLTFVVLFYCVVGVFSKQGFKYWYWLMVWIVTFSNLSATRKSWLPDLRGRVVLTVCTARYSEACLNLLETNSNKGRSLGNLDTWGGENFKQG